jgi:hypothetical protein
MLAPYMKPKAQWCLTNTHEVLYLQDFIEYSYQVSLYSEFIQEPGLSYLKGHLFKVGLTDDPTCKRCLEEDDQPYISYVIVRP